MALRTLSRLPALTVTKPTSCLSRSITSHSLSTTSVKSQAEYLLQDKESGFGFIANNPRTPKPRKAGVTEIRGPYYSAYGKRHLQDVMETMGHHVDGLKFAGGSFSLFPEKELREMIDIAHANDVYVSTVCYI